jgi:hypothetical protein
VVVKKKCPPTTTQRGRYVTLGSYRQNTFALDTWVPIRAQVSDEPNGAVAISLAERGRTLLTTTDTGIGCDPITAGAVGLRGDNDNFQVDDFTVTATSNSTE